MSRVKGLKGVSLKTPWGPSRRFISLDGSYDMAAARDLKRAHGLVLWDDDQFVVSSDIPEGIDPTSSRDLKWLVREVNRRISARSCQIAHARRKAPHGELPDPASWMLEPIKAPRPRGY